MNVLVINVKFPRLVLELLQCIEVLVLVSYLQTIMQIYYSIFTMFQQLVQGY